MKKGKKRSAAFRRESTFRPCPNHSHMCRRSLSLYLWKGVARVSPTDVFENKMGRGERGKWGNYCATFGKVPPSVNLTRMGCRRLGLGNTRRVSGYLDLSSSSVSFQFQEIQKILQIPRTTQSFIRIHCTLYTTALAVNLIIFPPFCRKRPKVD